MNELRQAAQQALEALEHHGGHLPWNAFVEVRKDLRAALAEPVQSFEDEQRAINAEQHRRADALAEPVQEEEGLIEFLADLQRSRMKYPNNRRMFDGLMSEVDELRRAYAGDGDIRAEAFDVAVCAFRIATEGDSGGNTMLKQAEPVQEPGFWGRVAARQATRIKQLETAAQQALEAWQTATYGHPSHHKATLLAMTALKATLAEPTTEESSAVEPVQEPVAKVDLMTTGGNAGLATRIVEIDDHLRERLRPGQLLYTAPPQRKPLTYEQISNAANSVRWSDKYHIDFARAIERAHGIGSEA